MIDRTNPKRAEVAVAAIVPARGGKQSIPYKNLLTMGGKSLLAWAIDIAFEVPSIDVVVVSTEDPKIAAEAEKLGAIVIPRPTEYSQPTSGDAGWYHQASTWMEEEKGWQPELLINLRPTGPLRFAEDIEAMIKYMKDNPDVDGLKSMIPAPIHPYKMWQFADEAGREVGTAGPVKSVFGNEYRQVHGPDQPRQKIQEMFPVYWQDAQIDITRRQFVLRPETLEMDNVWGPNIHGYVLDPRSVVDIDTLTDLHEAEKVYKELQAERKKGS